MNGAIRRFLRWCARSTWLAVRLQRRAFIGRAARRFIPGRDPADALGVAMDLEVIGIGTIYTALPDGASAAEAAQRSLDLLAQIRATDIHGEIGVDPVQLGLDGDPDTCLGRLRMLAAAADAQATWLWLEVDDVAAVDRVLDLYQRLRATHVNTGICLWACLRRTAKDVERLLPISPAVRLVKGDEGLPRSSAFGSATEIDANYAALAVTLLREGRSRPTMRVGFGTHDVDLVAQIASHAAAAGVARDGFEIHMRYGVRPREMRRLARSGYRVKTLITFGDRWYRWYMLRLAERPANVLLALRELLPR